MLLEEEEEEERKRRREKKRERERRRERREREREMLSVSVNSTRKVMKVAAAGASGGRLVTTRATRGEPNRSLSRSVVEANAEANNNANVNRRSLMLELGTAAAATLAFAYGGEAGGGVALADEVGDDYFPVSSLPKGAKAQQTAEVQGIVKEAVKKCVTEDYTTVLQLAFLDAITFDKSAKTGGANGSVRNSAELKALGLSDKYAKAIDQIGKAKAEAEKSAPFPLTLSWADTLVLAAYYKTQRHFIDSVLERAKDVQSANIILQGYANDFPVPPLGRVDADGSDASSLSLKTTDLVQRGLDNGLLAGEISALAVGFPTGTLEEVEAEIKDMGGNFKFYINSFQKSRTELTQTNYQIDLGRAFFKLSTLGAKFEPERYFRPVPKPNLKKKL